MTARTFLPNGPMMAVAVEQLNTESRTIEDRWAQLSSAEKAHQAATYDSVRFTLAGRLHPYFRVLSQSAVAGVCVGASR